jgi:hypothetical protein
MFGGYSSSGNHTQVKKIKMGRVCSAPKEKVCFSQDIHVLKEWNKFSILFLNYYSLTNLVSKIIHFKRIRSPNYSSNYFISRLTQIMLGKANHW